jgi:hypothetical protein
LYYLCAMKNEILVPDHFPDLKEEALKVAVERREKYSLGRDLLAKEFNDAIANRLLAESKNKLKCDKCGKEFNAGINPVNNTKCPDCR